MAAPELEQEAADASRMSPHEFLSAHYFGDKRRVAMFHRDKDYGLSPGSVNLWVPVTRVWGSNSLWLGGRTGGGRDAQPVEMEYGQALFFDGAERWHGATWNTSGSSRVSLDLRFRPAETPG